MPVTVLARDGEHPEELLKRFRKQVTKAGVLSAVKRKRWYISKSELKRLKMKKAIRRLRRKLRKRQMLMSKAKKNK